MNPQLEQFLQLLRRYPYCAACTLLTLALAGAAYYFSGQNTDLEVVRLDRAKEGEAMLALLVGGSTQRQELAAVREATRRIEDNLVVETNLAENAFYFYKFEEQTKARLPELHPLTSPASDTSALYRRVPYTLRVVGTYEQVSAFLFAIETGPRLANITAFGFSRRDTENVGVVLDLSLELLGKK
jgi:Tfp pilus assembly protein PilO